MEEDQEIKLAIMEKSVEFIKESVVKMDAKLDNFYRYVDKRFQEEEERNKNKFASKDIEKILKWLATTFLTIMVGIVTIIFQMIK